MSKYHEDLIEPGNPDNSQSVTLELVGPDRRVLDVGCSTGYLARALVRQGCTVSGIDNDAEAAEKARADLARLVVADLDTIVLADAFEPASFDVIVFGDVLEHLHDPRALLRQARPLLAAGGHIVISVPNVAHGDVAMALLRGDWDYQPVGLLDETHIRFFTLRTLSALLASCGFLPLETRRVGKPLFQTELGVSPEEFPAQVIDAVRRSPECETYQFVVRAVPDTLDGQVAFRAARDHDLSEQLHSLERRLDETGEVLAETRAELELTAGRLELAADRLALAEAERDIRIAEADHARGQVQALQATRTFRYARRAREAYGRLRAVR